MSVVVNGEKYGIQTMPWTNQSLPKGQAMMNNRGGSDEQVTEGV
ncbi:hypothetical protein [Jannaschia sp. AI_61]|nr:hypothetical protein [Jannaschia sp. AI_61]